MDSSTLVTNKMFKVVYYKPSHSFCFASDPSIDDADLIKEALELLGTFGDTEDSFYVKLE